MSCATKEELELLEKRVELIEFKQKLLFENSSIDRLLFEYNIEETQYKKLMDLMDKYRKYIEEDNEVNHCSFEQEVYEIVPSLNGNYHFCESLVLDFRNDGRWTEVFDNLYGDMPKYSTLEENN